jgi:hypothetical protein
MPNNLIMILLFRGAICSSCSVYHPNITYYNFEAIWHGIVMPIQTIAKTAV